MSPPRIPTVSGFVGADPVVSVKFAASSDSVVRCSDVSSSFIRMITPPVWLWLVTGLMKTTGPYDL
jgi:hypothetical protein